MTGSHEVIGSIPISSTIKNKGLREYPANLFGFDGKGALTRRCAPPSRGQRHPHPALRATLSQRERVRLQVMQAKGASPQARRWGGMVEGSTWWPSGKMLALRAIRRTRA